MLLLCSRRFMTTVPATLALLCGAVGADEHSSNCEPQWDGAIGQPGMDDDLDPLVGVYALTVYDDGTGPALYAGGRFTHAGGQEVNHIARWNPDTSEWLPLGSGVDGEMDFPRVDALTVFDGELIAGGVFTHAGAQPASYIAAWNGESWSPLGDGIGGISPSVLSLAVFDDGTGPALYVGGNFSHTGDQQEVNHIAKWDGSSWSPLGEQFHEGFQGTSVRALTVFDDGTGPALYAGGRFLRQMLMFDTPLNAIAKWNPDTLLWSPLGSGMDWITFPRVHALTVFDDGAGTGPALYAGGRFNTAGGVPANFIAEWDGNQWSPLDAGMNDKVFALTVFDDGSGDGPALYAGGMFSTAGGLPASRIAKWDGETWSALGKGLGGLVHALTVFDDGLYVGGRFTTAGGEDANHIAKWGCPASEFGVPGDLNGDGVVDVSDLLILFAAWGPCADPNDCPADLNGNGAVDVADLLILFDNWG
jgi:trimeric autotransporter adhesin